MKIVLNLAPYKLWPYEEKLKKIELNALVSDIDTNENTIKISPVYLHKLKRLTFYHSYNINSSITELTWQSIIENGDTKNITTNRKDPIYANHGKHPNKEKFYPQLVKPLLNISKAEPTSVVFDPFCGSGTVALEGLLNGYQAYGCDVNPIGMNVLPSDHQSEHSEATDIPVFNMIFNPGQHFHGFCFWNS